MRATLEDIIVLVSQLNQATLDYEQGHSTMTDEEWDEKYFQLAQWERDLGMTIPESPTQRVSFEIVNELTKVDHNHKMLSLDKTKDAKEVESFLKNQPFLAMCKMDGLTCSLHYQDGHLLSAETRGNGITGEDVTHNAKVIPSIPNRINYKEDLIIDGEIICTYDNFNIFSANYANPRNFAAGSIRLLDANECSKRHLTFVAWDVIEGFNNFSLLSEKLSQIKSLGFVVVPFIKTNIFDENLFSLVSTQAQLNSYPIDGVVFKFDNIAYGKAQGETSHHFKNAIAYKFYDETYSTHLRTIQWTMGRTGILTPVAVFDPVEIDGSIIERASLHNYSIMQEILGDIPYIGQPIEVFKANMIIPQVAKGQKWNKIDFISPISIPLTCPICGNFVTIETNNDIKNVKCNNVDCKGKLINRLNHFCGKKGLDIKGLSSRTLEKLIDYGWLDNLSDIFNLSQYKNEWIKKEGFGIKSVENILAAIDIGRITTLDKFLASLGIPLIGDTVAKEITKYCDTYEKFRKLVDTKFDFSQWDGFADAKTQALWNFNYDEADLVYSYLTINNNSDIPTIEQNLSGLSFVISGKLQQVKNRNELKELIEQLGGKVIDSVSGKTNYLISNNKESTSSKINTAKKLKIPIITEKEFFEKFLDK